MSCQRCGKYDGYHSDYCKGACQIWKTETDEANRREERKRNYEVDIENQRQKHAYGLKQQELYQLTEMKKEITAKLDEILGILKAQQGPPAYVPPPPAQPSAPAINDAGNKQDK